jgi:hypothetical protein
MSCNDTENPCGGALPCGDVNVPVVSAGIKISQLPTVTSASANDLFVIVDYSAQRTKNITFEDLIGSISGSGIIDVTSAGTHLRETGGWVYFDPTTKVDTSAFYPMSAIDHTVIQNIGIYAHSAVDVHIDDTTIHYVVSAIDHTSIQNIGTYTHNEIDYHISATNNPHLVTKTQIGLSAVDNTSDLDKPISTATQTALDLKFDTSGINQYTTTANFNSHTSDYSIHYPMSAIDGLNPVGGDSGQVLTKITSADYDYEWVDTNTSFPEVVDYNTYLRTSGSWIQSDVFVSGNYYTNNDVDILLTSYTTTANFETHVDDYSIHYPMSAIDGLVISGGNSGQVLTKITSADYIYSWQTPQSSVPLYGPTSARPISPNIGTIYTDTDLGYFISYIPPNWVNATGAIV